LPEPIVELEKLALDLTIRKVERQSRASQAVPEEEEEPAEQATAPTVGEAVHSFGTALGELAQAFTSLMFVLGLRPVFYALWIIAPLRFIGRTVFSPVGLAAGLPIATLLGVTIYLLDTNITFESAGTARPAQFREHEPSPAIVGKDEERIAGDIEPPPVGAAPVPARARATASPRSYDGMYDPPFEVDVVGAGTRAAAPMAAPSLAAKNPVTLPKWFAAYSRVSEASSAAVESGPPAPPPASAPTPYQLAAANSTVAIPDDQPLRPTLSTISLPQLRAPSPKVAALIETGKKAAIANDLEKAVHDFTEAVRIDPNYAAGYSERGQALFELGETDRALSDLSRAIQVAEIDPNRLSPLELFYARRSRATIYGTRMQLDAEIADYSAIIEAYKRDEALNVALVGIYRAEDAVNLIAAIYRQRANAYTRRSNPELARADLTAAATLSAGRDLSGRVDRPRLNEAIGQRRPGVD